MNDKHEATTDRCETKTVSRVTLLCRENIPISHQETHQTSRLLVLPKLYSGPCFRGTLKIHMNKKHKVKTEQCETKAISREGLLYGGEYSYFTPGNTSNLPPANPTQNVLRTLL